jgi:hypothetical protein
MPSSTSLNRDIIWLKWEMGFDLSDSSESVALIPVLSKADAQCDGREDIGRRLAEFEPKLNTSMPGYTWAMQPVGGWPIPKYVIRGERASSSK